MAFNLTESNPWLGFAREQPEAMYRAFIPQGQSSNFLDYWKRQYGDIYGDYWSGLAGTSMSGQPPSQNFEDYLSGFPWLQRYMGLPPEERGERASLYNPRMRWNI